MRQILFALVLATASPTAAQSAPPAASDEAALVQHRLSAIWRALPVNPSGSPDQIFAAACDGAVAELDELAAAFPADLTPDAVRGLMTTRGLVIVPGAENGQIFLFPNPTLSGMVGGLGSFTLVNRAEGRVDLHDAAGAPIPVQLGAAGGKAMLRLLRPNADPLTFVGCASTAD
jgi:hypothetical protein